MRSSTEGGLGSISRGRSRCCSSMSRFMLRSSQCTDRSSSGTPSMGGSVLPGRPHTSACSASRAPSHAPCVFTRAYSRSRSSSSCLRASASSSSASSAVSSGGTSSFDFK